MSYQHVLVALDLSDESHQVLEKAHHLAQSDGAKLSAVAVVKPLTQVYGGLDMAPISSGAISFEEEALTQAQAQINEIVARYGVGQDQAHVVLGSPAHEIKQCAHELGADLIIIGTHGRHGLGLLLGSTANGVLHGVDIDVLAVRIAFED
jgi:universal stress protein A